MSSDTESAFKVAIIQHAPIFLSNDALEILQVFEGESEQLVLKGGSAVIGPDSSYLAGPVFDRSEIIYGVIEPQRMIEGRLAIDTSGHYSRPDVLQLAVNASPQSGISFNSERK